MAALNAGSSFPLDQEFEVRHLTILVKTVKEARELIENWNDYVPINDSWYFAKEAKFLNDLAMLDNVIDQYGSALASHQITVLAKTLKEAREMIACWGDYAIEEDEEDYFDDSGLFGKKKLNNDLAILDGAISQAEKYIMDLQVNNHDNS
jgi:hypothetical protein